MDELITFANRYAAAWCSQSPESVAAFFVESGLLRVNDGPPAIGRTAIAEVARGFMTAFPDIVVTFDQLVLTPEGADFHWTLTGTNNAPNGTGKKVCISGHEEWRLGANGLVEESRGYFDAAEYHRQLEHDVAS